MSRLENFTARLSAGYSLAVYMPIWRMSEALKRASRRFRRKPLPPPMRLAQVDWQRVIPNLRVRMVATEKRHGNVRLSELAILAKAASSVEPGSEIVEIGTFDGRTALNFAVNAPEQTSIITLDLPMGHHTKFQIELSEQQLVDKPVSGERIRSCRPAWRDYAKRITQVFGDSASYDWSPYYGRAGLVFVDGSHAYEYVLKDSATAFRLSKPRGLVIWHDYGVWPGVTRALEELDDVGKLGLRQIRGTSMVIWRAPDTDQTTGISKQSLT